MALNYSGELATSGGGGDGGVEGVWRGIVSRHLSRGSASQLFELLAALRALNFSGLPVCPISSNRM